MTQPWGDIDPTETKEWMQALASIVKFEGKERAEYILRTLIEYAKNKGIDSFFDQVTTDYVNTISKEQEPAYPGDVALEEALEAIIRWNAICLVAKRRKVAEGVGGHLASFASIATLYEVGQHHFFKGATNDRTGDLVYFQGHSSEGNYARAYLEGRLSEAQLNNFRAEVDKDGLSSYPHPWLMPSFWQFATVSLGLGMLQGVYQARFMRYLEHRGFLEANHRKVWVFCGDGEMDEPESMAGLTAASREKLDNLVFVVNANLQRLDGLVRGNGKIIQELEGVFKGAGWNVIKVLWDSKWDALFAKDKAGLLKARLLSAVDGELQKAYVEGGAYMREHLFNTDELKALVADWSDDELSALSRGAHDRVKIFAAYEQAMQATGKPTVVIAQGVKGYGLGKTGAESRNIAHNQLDMTDDELKAFRDRFQLTLTDDKVAAFDYIKPADDHPVMQYMQKKRAALGGYLPERTVQSQPLTVPPLSAFDAMLQGSNERTMSTTMALGRILNTLLKDKTVGKRIVPIFSDEVRTFGMEALFRQVGIYSPVGQLYKPEDESLFLYYKEAVDGQVLEEGITEAGCMASWIAAATSYSTHRVPMLPIFTYYSMFGFQRVGDLIWAAADMRARGFLIGATAGRTTLEGEGLQHQDGTSLLVAATVPSCRAYDPAFGYEMAVIMQHGANEMLQEEKDVFYYITAMNEKYLQPAMTPGVEEGIIKGMYLFNKADKAQLTVQLLGSGAILNEVIAAAELLKAEFDIAANVWSVTSFSELRRDCLSVERHNQLHPEAKAKTCYLKSLMAKQEGPIIAATDYVRSVADLVRPFLNRPYYTLGTEGYGRSDTRAALRHFFEVDRHHIAFLAIHALYKEEKVSKKILLDAMKRFGIDSNKPDPTTV